MPAKRQGAPYVLGLDLIRLCTATGVMLYHLGFCDLVRPDLLLARALDTDAIFPWTGAWTRSGWVGVEIFFVLSGAVISASADGKEAGRFLAGRLLRLYPAVWVCATFSLAAAALSARGGAEFATYLHSLLIAPSGPWIEGGYWTLPIEMSFYLFVGALLMWRGGERVFDGILIVGLASAVYWVVWRVCGLAAGRAEWIGALGEALGFTVFGRGFDLALIHHGCFFALGALIHRVFGLRAPSRWTWAAPILAGGCWVEIVAINGRHAMETGRDLSALAPVAMWTGAVALIVLSFWRREQIAGFCSPRFSAWARFGGLMTYPLYLCHVSLAFAAMKGFYALGLPSMVAWVAGLAAATGGAIAVTAWAEPRVRRATVWAAQRLAASRAAMGGAAP